MTIKDWIQIGLQAASLIIGTIVALSIAASNRKQSRQIELHRLDPTVPLVPPSHPFYAFTKRNGIPFLIACLNLYILVNELMGTGPITRSQVFEIAFSTAVLFAVALVYIVWWVFEIMFWMNKENQDRIFESAENILKLAKSVGKLHKSKDTG
jgi:hypothetical protein